MRQYLLATLAGLVMVWAAGCNIVGPIAYAIEGTGTTPAQYTLPDVPTVVFIDDRINSVNPTLLRKEIAMRASTDLMEKKALSTTISPVDAMAVASQADRNNDLMSIDEIGRSVGADVVIYVEMQAFQRSADGASTRPFATCQVRVIDVKNQVRLFPAPDSEVPSAPVSAMTREVDPSLMRDRSKRLKVYQELAEELGGNIARLFYKHERVDLGGNLKPR